MPFEPPETVLRTAGADGWTLVEPLTYVGERDRFVVPAGFGTDLATVPRPVLWLVPRSGRYTLAAVLHDWLCTVGIRTGVVTSRQADGVFRRVMREAGVPVLLRWLMWTAVRWGALADPERRPGWVLSAPGVLAISALAAPLVLPPSLLVVPGLLVYAARWASKPLNTFAEAIEAFRTAMSFRFVEWLTQNRDVFAAYKASLGFIWA